jgi:hypothetical protein
MAVSRTIVKVFLASPSDLGEERRAAKIVIDDLNELWADDFGFQIELVGWEDTVSVYGRPQEIINRDLEQCELFVGMMWKKWGTPPGGSSTYTSGFEEEFETSVQRRIITGQPEISLLLKDIEADYCNDPGVELKKVLEFRDRLIAGKAALFQTFADLHDFESKFRKCVGRYILQLRRQEHDMQSIKAQVQTDCASDDPAGGEGREPDSEGLLSPEGAQFVRDFVRRLEGREERKNIAAVDIARFRLIGNLVGCRGNDESVLGVHDANLIFADRDKLVIGRAEIVELIAAGLRYFVDENTPVWHWIAAAGEFGDDLLVRFATADMGGSRNAGAIKALMLIGDRLPTNYREQILEVWFAHEASSALKIAALEYLGKFGAIADVSRIRAEFDKGDSQTSGAAAEAIIRIQMRESQESGIRALYDIQPTGVSADLVDALFGDDAGLSTSMLVDGIGHKSVLVRRVIVRLLRDRGELATNLAEQALNDSDMAVKIDAMRALLDEGRKLQDDEIKNICAARAQDVDGYSQWWVANSAWADLSVNDCVEEVHLHFLRNLNDKDLEAMVVDSSILDQRAWLVLAERQFGRYGPELRSRVDDEYKRVFDADLAAIAERHGASTARTAEKVRSLEEFLRKDLTRRALDILCRQAKREDLSRIRGAARARFVPFSVFDIEYFGKCGDWEDIQLIIDGVGRLDWDLNFHRVGSRRVGTRTQMGARAIYEIGRSRFAEVVMMRAPGDLIAAVVANSSEAVFSGLDNSVILEMLHSEADQLRKVVSLKCVSALSKRRVARLLEVYSSASQKQYYNAVHWLDLGVSMPRARAMLAARRALRQ